MNLAEIAATSTISRFDGPPRTRRNLLPTPNLLHFLPVAANHCNEFGRP
jgi:hypothetical protein